ncbi:MAG: hypothetical protein JW795_11710, partial [Chitinivibrionales bacterium]|nr:hypothetical protein [Chitinivibrionales bacterium]
LVIEVIGGSSGTNSANICTDVTVASHAFYVIGNGSAPPNWVNINKPLRLSSTDKWIVLRRSDRSVVDWVAYSSACADWPSKKSRTSIVLDSLAVDGEYNNYGRHWKTAQTPIDSSGHIGTPGCPGI